MCENKARQDAGECVCVAVGSDVIDSSDRDRLSSGPVALSRSVTAGHRPTVPPGGVQLVSTCRDVELMVPQLYSLFPLRVTIVCELMTALKCMVETVTRVFRRFLSLFVSWYL